MNGTADNAGGTAPTCSTLLEEINELCLQIMRLSLNTKQTPEGKEHSKEKCHLNSCSICKKADRPRVHISQHPHPPVNMKRKHYGVKLQNEGSRGEDPADRQRDEFMPEAKKMCRGLPMSPATLHTTSPSYTNAKGEKQAQPSCAPALSLAESQQKTQESCKADGLKTGKEEKSQPKPLLQKQLEVEKPSGKRKCKTKHLEVKTRKRSFFAMDDPFDIEDTQDLVALPNKMMKQAEPTFHHGSLPAKVCQQKLHNQLQQPPSLPTI